VVVNPANVNPDSPEIDDVKTKDKQLSEMGGKLSKRRE
jgi:hypothetical protein